MAETATIARPYAEAVFGLADKAGASANWLDMLATLAQVAGNPEMQSTLDRKRAALGRLTAGPLTPDRFNP